MTEDTSFVESPTYSFDLVDAAFDDISLSILDSVDFAICTPKYLT